MSTITDEDFYLLKTEVDSLQVTMHRPWYTHAPVLIALLALLFSFGTTVVSYYSTSQQSVREARTELRGLLQRLIALPRENFELMNKYNGDSEGAALSKTINAENTLLATQAFEIIERFPDAFSSSEYSGVAVALSIAGDTGRAIAIYERAIENSETINDRVVGLRQYGGILYSLGQTEEGRAQYRRALSVWPEFPASLYNEAFKDSMDSMTLMYWAQEEGRAGNLSEARQHITAAFDLANSLPPGHQTQWTLGQIRRTSNAIEETAGDR